MSFGDNIKQILKNTAKIAVKKSGEVIETAKSKYNEFDIQNEIDKTYKDLGRLVYEGYKNDKDVSDVITGLCHDIDEKMINLNNIKNKSGDFSYSIVCPSCSAGCEPNTAYCPNCGEKLS